MPVCPGFWLFQSVRKSLPATKGVRQKGAKLSWDSLSGDVRMEAEMWRGDPDIFRSTISRPERVNGINIGGIPLDCWFGEYSGDDVSCMELVTVMLA